MTKIRYHLLIVDDEPTIREGIKLALGDDYRVTGFANAEDALASHGKGVARSRASGHWIAGHERHRSTGAY